MIGNVAGLAAPLGVGAGGEGLGVARIEGLLRRLLVLHPHLVVALQPIQVPQRLLVPRVLGGRVLVLSTPADTGRWAPGGFTTRCRGQDDRLEGGYGG